jgi:hypothetical protein
MAVLTAQELADYAADAYDNALPDDPSPYEMGRAWKSVGQSLFEILAERAEEERAPDIAYLVNQLDAIRRQYWLSMSFEKQDALTAAMAALDSQAAENKRLREALANIQIEAEREEGRWVHLKRVIAINARAALTGTPQ